MASLLGRCDTVLSFGTSSKQRWTRFSKSSESPMKSSKQSPFSCFQGSKISNGVLVACFPYTHPRLSRFLNNSDKSTGWLSFGSPGGISTHLSRSTGKAYWGIRSTSLEIEEKGSFFQVSDNMKDSSTGVICPVLDCENWHGAVSFVGRTLPLCCAAACAAWLLSAGGVHACSESNLPAALLEQAGLSSVKGAMWPKILQVLSVFKDQGLLLSALLGLSAFFSMAETSIMTLWPWKVRELAEKEGEGGVFRLLRQDVTRFLTTILIGTTVVNIAATALVTDAATSLFGEAGVTAATGVMTARCGVLSPGDMSSTRVVILLVTEIAPKSIAVHNATEVARFAVRPVAWLSVILYPVGRVVTAMSMALLKCLGLKSSGEPFVSEEELKLMLRGAELSGAIEEEEQDMIENVLEIKDTFVREVMTPLVDVVAIDAESTLMEFRNYWVKHQYSRTPIFERRVDNIVGIAYAMDMLDYVDYDTQQVAVLKNLTVGHIAHRPAYFVPGKAQMDCKQYLEQNLEILILKKQFKNTNEAVLACHDDSMSVWNLLREFRIRKVHMAIVLNEYGGTVGVVTLEDVVEEIVGEIFDENDSKEEIRKKTGYVIQRAHDVFDVDANTHIEDLSEALEVRMPEGPYRYETVSGFVCEAFGYIPRIGQSINVILKKADVVDAQDGREVELHHLEDHNDNFQKYRVEILAGNARKVGAVRFEIVKSQSKEDEVVFPQNTRVFGKGWAEPVEDSGKCEPVSNTEDEFREAEPMTNKEGCTTDIALTSYPMHRYLSLKSAILEGDRVETIAPRNNYLGMGLEEWEMLSTKPAINVQDMKNDSEVILTEVNNTLSQRFVEQEKQEERSVPGRRRHDAINQSRQGRVDGRRQEVDLAMAALRQERDDQRKSGNFFKPST